MSDVIVRRYQLRAPVDEAGTAAAERQYRLQQQMWNRLIELDQAFRERVAALTAGEGSVVAAERALQALKDRRAALIAERKQLRREARRRVATPEIDAELAALKPQVAAAGEALRAARREARAACRGGPGLERLRERLAAAKAARQALLDRRSQPDAPSREELAAAREAVRAIQREIADLLAAQPDTIPAIEAERQRAVVAVRQEFAALGLHWGNYNAVIASYETARRRVMARGGSLRFHGAGDRARLTAQVQGGMAVDRLLAGGTGQVGLAPCDPAIARRRPSPYPPSRRRTPAMRMLQLRVDGETTARWPLLLSRPLAPGSRVKQVTVTRERIASHYRHAAVFVATPGEDAAPAPTATGPAMAVDFGWRRLVEGIRVATGIVAGENMPRHIVCPERLISGLAEVDRIRAQRDEHRNQILRRLCEIGWRVAPEALAEIGLRLRRQPASGFGRIARLALVWRSHADWRPEELAATERWRAGDKRAWEHEVNLRDRLLAHRLDHYRKAAAAILNGVGVLILEDFDIARAARIETAAGDETEQLPPMRRYRTIAAPGLLRDWLIQQARKRGIAIHYHRGESNHPHAACGTRHAPRDPAALRQYCPGCGGYYDVDENACRNMLAAYAASSGEASGASEALAHD